MNCPSCGAELPDTAAFCMGCGTHLSPTPAETPIDPLHDALVKALGPQYEVMRLLGRGGMGAVYLAREKALDRLVAIKMLPPEASDEESRERFRREARTAAKLTHPNIVPLHSFGESDGMMYFVMGYVRGESLSDRMAREGKISPVDTRRILGGLADALDYAHKQGVVHRDIKPDNVLVDDESGRPMLTDFGVAKAQASGQTLTEVGVALGTPHYMSPEQASGERNLDGRSDIYSLGIMGYQMLAGRLPFEGGTYQEIVVQHVTKEATPIESVEPSVPSDLSQTLARCLAKEPDQRWAKAAALRDLLRTHVAAKDDLPESLKSIDGQLVGFWLPATTALGYLVLISELWGVPDGGMGWGTLLLVPGLILFLGLTSIPKWLQERKTAKQKVTLRDVWRALFKQPRWWKGWYPRNYRRKDMEWDRLPKLIRWMRSIMFAGGGGGALSVLTTFLFLLAPIPPGPVLEMLSDSFLLMMAGGAAAFFGPGFGAFVWGKKRGLSDLQIAGMLGFDEEPALWQDPAVARVLEEVPASIDELPTIDPTNPGDLVRAVEAVKSEIGDIGRDLFDQSLSAARQLVAAVNTVDKEIEKLSRDVQPAEIAKLEQKLSAIAGDDEYDEQIRTLTLTQLDLMRRLSERLEAAEQRRERMVDLMKTLWYQVSNLRAQSVQEDFDASEITGKIRALCEDIDRHGSAVEETVRMVAPSG